MNRMTLIQNDTSTAIYIDGALFKQGVLSFESIKLCKDIAALEGAEIETYVVDYAWWSNQNEYPENLNEVMGKKVRT